MATYRKLLKNRNGDIIIPVTDLMSDFSTSEINTGCHWIDGKPIYKKTIIKDGGIVSGNNDIPVGVLIDNLVEINGSVGRISTGIFFMLPYVRPNPGTGLSDQLGVRIIATNNLTYVRIEAGSGNYNFDDMRTVINIKYTK